MADNKLFKFGLTHPPERYLQKANNPKKKTARLSDEVWLNGWAVWKRSYRLAEWNGCGWIER